MAGLDFKAPVDREREADAVVAYNTRMGVGLFLIYLLFYGGFMALSAFRPHIMSTPFLGGVNVSVLYGFALIVLALVLALVYLRACRKTA